MIIQKIDKDSAFDFIFKYHYSNVMPRLTKHFLGFYDNDKLVGVITLGWGTQPLQTIKKIFPNENLTSQDYLEIGKMCFIKTKNSDGKSGSIIISMLRKWIKQNWKKRQVEVISIYENVGDQVSVSNKLKISRQAVHNILRAARYELFNYGWTAIQQLFSHDTTDMLSTSDD